MRLNYVFIAAILATVNAGWFSSSSPQYTSWSTQQLSDWLSAHNISPPAANTHASLLDTVKANWDATLASSQQWSEAQYVKAQKAFGDVKDATFDAWDESKLREFLLEQGIVAPKGPKEQLVMLAKTRYYSYGNFAAKVSASGSSAYGSATDAAASAASSVSKSGASVYGEASKSATSAYGAASKAASSGYAASSKSFSSAAAAATTSALRQADATKDYVYSTWDDNQLRSFLEKNGAIAKGKADQTRADLLKATEEYYAKATTPVWETWSDSYIRDWLIVHGIIEPSVTSSPRSTLTSYMKKYYFSLTDTVYGTWSESQLKGWLIKNGYIKSDAQVQREKMISLVEDNYLSAKDTLYESWTDSDMRQWLVDNGYIKTEAQIKRDQLVNLMSEKYNDGKSAVASYLTWPDARLRAYLRESGVPESALPGGRPGLLQETRIRWIQTSSRAEGLVNKIKDLISDSAHAAEDSIARILELLSGTPEYLKDKANEKGTEARLKTGDAVKKGGQKIKGEL